MIDSEKGAFGPGAAGSEGTTPDSGRPRVRYRLRFCSLGDTSAVAGMTGSGCGAADDTYGVISAGA